MNINKNELLEAMKDAVSGSNDLWAETKLAFSIITGDEYAGQEDDIDFIILELQEINMKDVEDIICSGDWYFQETKKWEVGYIVILMNK